MHGCVGAERQPLLTQPQLRAILQSSHGLKGKQVAGGPGSPHPGTGLEGTLPRSPQSKRQCRCPLWPHSLVWDPRPLWPHWALGVASTPALAALGPGCGIHTHSGRTGSWVWHPRPLWPHWALGVGSTPTQHLSLSSEFSLLDT